jgi:YidC/Oxa1 family membrane protein insertase
LYLGPKEYGKIEEVVTGLHYTLDYGWLDIIADPLSWGIHKINDFVGSWGWSIILTKTPFGVIQLYQATSSKRR